MLNSITISTPAGAALLACAVSLACLVMLAFVGAAPLLMAVAAASMIAGFTAATLVMALRPERQTAR